jgi:Na+-driven multidrug efflux pump
MLITNLSALLTSLAYPYALTWFHGLGNAAIFYAIINAFKPANPIMSSMTGLIVPAVARAMSSDGPKAARRLAIRYTAFGAILLLPYFLLLIFFPTQVLEFFYKKGHPYTQHGHLLRLFVANYTAVYLLCTFGGWLSALGRSRWLFYSQIVNIIVSLAIGLPLIIKWGVEGLIIGGMFAAFSTAAVVLYYIHKAAYRNDPSPVAPA